MNYFDYLNLPDDQRAQMGLPSLQSAPPDRGNPLSPNMDDHQLSGPGPNTVLADGTAAYVPGEVNRACDNRYAPVANANGYCNDCGQSIALHAMVPLAEWAEVEERVRLQMLDRLARKPLPPGTPIRWYHRLWWRLVRQWVIW